MKTCLYCKLPFKENSHNQTICFPCFKLKTNQREIALDEVVLDCDSREFGDLGLITLTNFFSEQGYRIEVYKAEGQKSPHAHIKGIPDIANLPKNQNTAYKKLLIQKYIAAANKIMPCPELVHIDIDELYSHPKHLIAEEFKPHFKYGTENKLLGVLNDELKNFCEPDVYNAALEEKEKDKYEPTIQGSGITAKIVQVINIKDIATQFGLSLHGNKCLCPFHADGKTPSLVFYEQQGRFHCFGCSADGNIIAFYAMLKDLKPNFVFKKPQEVAVV